MQKSMVDKWQARLFGPIDMLSIIMQELNYPKPAFNYCEPKYIWAFKASTNTNDHKLHHNLVAAKGSPIEGIIRLISMAGLTKPCAYQVKELGEAEYTPLEADSLSASA